MLSLTYKLIVVERLCDRTDLKKVIEKGVPADAEKGHTNPMVCSHSPLLGLSVLIPYSQSP